MGGQPSYEGLVNEEDTSLRRETWFPYDCNVKLSEARNDLVLYQLWLKGNVHIKCVYAINIHVCCVGTQNLKLGFLVAGQVPHSNNAYPIRLHISGFLELMMSSLETLDTRFHLSPPYLGDSQQPPPLLNRVQPKNPFTFYHNGKDSRVLHCSSPWTSPEHPQTWTSFTSSFHELRPLWCIR